MPIPVINTTQSVLYATQNQDFEFQPYALYGVDTWVWSSLPPGITYNSASGKTHGRAEKPGVYVCALRALNAEGGSDPIVFTFGIKAGISDPDANVIDLVVDLTTKRVSLIDFPQTDPKEPLFAVKFGDAQLFRVRFRRMGVDCTIALTALKFGLKELDPEKLLVEASEQVSLGESTYLLPVAFNSPTLKTSLSNYEGDDETRFSALGELEWIASNSIGVSSGAPSSLRGSSRTFLIDIFRDLIP